MATISKRDTILETFKTDLKNITVAKGFQNDVFDVVRKSVYFDQIESFPLLMVLGAGEVYDDTMGTAVVSKMDVNIAGYSKDTNDPESALCSIIADVLKCIDNATYNTQKKNMIPRKLDTDEGALHEAAEGLAMFILTVEVIFAFSWGS